MPEPEPENSRIEADEIVADRTDSSAAGKGAWLSGLRGTHFPRLTSHMRCLGQFPHPPPTGPKTLRASINSISVN
jgi:hypothetical protein